MSSTPSSRPLVSRLASLMPWSRAPIGAAGESCCIPADIHFGTVPSGSAGLILEISQTDLLFREASHFLLDRTGRRVQVAFLSSQVAGTIVASRSNGYRIRLASPLDGDLVAALLDEYGVEPTRS